MSEKEIKTADRFGKAKAKKQVSEDQALDTFILEGILHNECNCTDNYHHLFEAMALKVNRSSFH